MPDIPTAYVVLTPQGYMADWDSRKGGVVYTACLDDAALFTAESARAVQASPALSGAAILTTDGRLCLLTEVV